MPATIVVGGQYGSEGKGKVVALIAQASNDPWVVRCGGPNSGHSITVNGKEEVFRQIPSSVNFAKTTYCIAAGCVVDEEILIRELEYLNISRDRIIVDPRAILVSEQDREQERTKLKSIGSTCSGTGLAQIRRMLRTTDVRFTKDSPKLNSKCRIEFLAPLLHDRIEDGKEVIVEGTQGFALSLLHGRDYPYVTSRDTTASAFAMEAGLSPRHVERIVMVLRTFPIRVAGTSGPLRDEISWDDVRRISGAPEPTLEYTSVTKKLRRVAKFDLDLVRMACHYNCPTSLAVMGIDRMNHEDFGVRELKKLSRSSKEFLDHVEVETKIPIEYVGTGFGTFDSICSSDSGHSLMSYV